MSLLSFLVLAQMFGQVLCEFINGVSASELEVERHIQVRDEYRLARTHVLVRMEEKIWIRRSCLNSIENCNNISGQPLKGKRVVDEHLVHVSNIPYPFHCSVEIRLLPSCTNIC